MTTGQDKQQAIGDYFRALGWKYHEWNSPEGFYQVWENPNGKDVDIGRGEELPNIIDHYPSFKKHVLEKMEGEGYQPDIRRVCDLDGNGFLGFSWDELNGEWDEIVGNEITLAAVKAATRYWRELKK